MVVHLDTDGIDKMLSGAKPGTFFIMCGIKNPNEFGLILKSEKGIQKRPLVTRNTTIESVLENLMRYEELKGAKKIEKVSDGIRCPTINKEDLPSLFKVEILRGRDNDEFPDKPLAI